MDKRITMFDFEDGKCYARQGDAVKYLVIKRVGHRLYPISRTTNKISSYTCVAESDDYQEVPDPTKATKIKELSKQVDDLRVLLALKKIELDDLLGQ